MLLWIVDVPGKANSACRACKRTIDAGSLRFQSSTPDPLDSKSCYHAACANRLRGIGPLDRSRISKTLGLTAAKRDELNSLLDGNVRGAPKTQASPKQGVVKRSAPAPPEPAAKRARTEVLRRPAAAPLRPLPVARAPKAAKEKGAKGFPASDVSKLRVKVEALQALPGAKLKDFLKKNDQSRSGNKAVLVAKVADGQAFGKLPRCPKCHGGKLKFRMPGPDGELASLFRIHGGAYGDDKKDDEKAGKHAAKKRYYCTGYFDDDEKVDCEWQADSVKREAWLS